MSHSVPDSINSEAIVLRTFPYGEADLVLRLLCKGHGKTSAMAKGAKSSKRRYSNRFDIFDHGTFTLHFGRGSMPSVNGYTPGIGLRQLREDLAKLSAASLLCESCDALIPDDAHDSDAFFECLLAGLLALNACADVRETLRTCFLSSGQILVNAGYLDPQELGAPSSKGLLKLIHAVETHSERELLSKAQIVSFFSDLAPKTQSDRT